MLHSVERPGNKKSDTRDSTKKRKLPLMDKSQTTNSSIDEDDMSDESESQINSEKVRDHTDQDLEVLQAEGSLRLDLSESSDRESSQRECGEKPDYSSHLSPQVENISARREVQQPFATTTSFFDQINSNFGLLERCGRWIISIPRDDVVALQSTVEYKEFLNAFERLGEAHRRTVMLERRNLLETGDATLLATALSPVEAMPSRIFTRFHSQALPSTSGSSPRRQYSFLQHLVVDDVLLRIFEFNDCSSLVRTGTTCHRFHELANRSAEQRTNRLADGRLLRSAMKMLRAQEQIEGVNILERGGPYVPIPMLGLRGRVKVSGTGDAEFNGIYFCTGSNGNGFLFTKPRVPERRVRCDSVRFGQPVVSQIPLARAELNRPTDLEMVGAMEIPAREERIIVGPDDINDDVDGADDDDDDFDSLIEHESGVDVLFGDEPNRSRQLRCVIAKRFSNETILWYMSKEVEDDITHEISQMFFFWAKLMVTGEASPDVCRYPSQTSILSRNGEPAWQPVSSTVGIAPPIVELLDT